MATQVDLTGRVEEIPVVTTGRRWPTPNEGDGSENYFTQFPECRDDPLRNSFGTAPTYPDPFEKGGGFFPVALSLDDGRLCCATRTGSPHVGSGGEISLSFSSNQGKHWTGYSPVVRGDPEKNLDMRNPAFGQNKVGQLVLTYGIMEHTGVRGRISKPNHPDHAFQSIQVVLSSDDGSTWSDPVELEFPERGLLLHPHGQMRRLLDGTMVFNARGYYTKERYAEDPTLPQRMSYLYWSFDGGQTWPNATLLRASGSETGFLPLDELHWVAYVRFNDGPNQFAHSMDSGQTWTIWNDTVTQERGGASPGSLVKLANGNVLATYGYRDYPFGVRAVISRDGGNSFDLNHEYVISSSAFHPDCGYPSTTCFEDGSIVTCGYSLMDIRHPEWGSCCIAYRYPQTLFD